MKITILPLLFNSRPAKAFNESYYLFGDGVLGFPVPPEIHFPLELLLANPAGERLVAGVLPHVRDQIRRLAERFPAHDTPVRFLSWQTDKQKHIEQVEKKVACRLYRVLLHVACICICLLYTSPSPRDRQKSRMPSSA